MTALHFSSGISPRNGTTSRTINFTTDGSAPFTPTAGSLLVFAVFGAVTNANSGGWTEQLQPVNSGELSVFTITAAGTAGSPSSTTSITITNNGSNYTEVWAVWEYPAGSTYGPGASGNIAQGSSGVAKDYQQLTGLTGTKTIHAILGNVDSATAAATVSTVWTSPLVEAMDILAADDGTTDGAYMTAAVAAGQTASSFTPNANITWSDGGSGFANDIQSATFAVTEAAGTITKEFPETYRVLNSVTKNVSETYRVFNSVTKDVAETYRVLNSVTKNVAESYRVLNSGTKNTTESYRVFNAVQKDVSESYRVLNAQVKNALETYRIFNAVTKDFAESYNVLGGTTITKDFTESYRVLNAGTKDVGESYRIINSVTKNSAEQYRILNAGQLDKPDSWRVYNAFVRDFLERYNIDSDIPPSPLPADVRAVLADRVTAIMTPERVTARL